MKLTYTPEGEEPREFIFKPEKLMSFDQEAIEDIGGQTWRTFLEFSGQLVEWRAKAKRAALWLMLRRDNPRLQFSELVLGPDELLLAWDDDEIARFQKAAAESEDSEERRQLEVLLAELGKAPSSPMVEESEPDTDTTSPTPDKEL